METEKITSFIIRFFHDDPTEGGRLHRGVISHVQDEEELGFTQWGDAVEFIRKFVPLDIGENVDQTKTDHS